MKRHLPAAGLTLLFAISAIVSWGQQIPAAQRAYDSGVRLEEQGRHKEASESFARAVDINPEFVDAYYQLGFSRLHAGETQPAIQAFIHLLQLDPTQVRAMLAAADAYVDFGLFDDALALYSRALSFEPNSASIHYKLGYALFRETRIRAGHRGDAEVARS